MAAVAAGPKALFALPSRDKPRLEIIKEEQFDIHLFLDEIPSNLVETYGCVNIAQFKQWPAGTLRMTEWSMDRIWKPAYHVEGRNGSSSSSRASHWTFSLNLGLTYRKEGWNRVYVITTNPRLGRANWQQRFDHLPEAEGKWIEAPLYTKASFDWLANAEISPRHKSSGTIVKPRYWGKT